jgi:hypothetical protein
MAANRTQDTTFLGARYRRLARRIGKLKALVAIQHSILTAVPCVSGMSYPRTPTTTTSAATTTPNATPNEPYDASPATLTVSATPSASTPSKPHNSPNAASVTAIFDAGFLAASLGRRRGGKMGVRPSGTPISL